VKEVTGTASVSHKLLVDLTGVPHLVPLESIDVDQVHLGSRGFASFLSHGCSLESLHSHVPDDELHQSSCLVLVGVIVVVVIVI
jgi:hypothetical protein